MIYMWVSQAAIDIGEIFLYYFCEMFERPPTGKDRMSTGVTADIGPYLSFRPDRARFRYRHEIRYRAKKACFLFVLILNCT